MTYVRFPGGSLWISTPFERFLERWSWHLPRKRFIPAWSIETGRRVYLNPCQIVYVSNTLEWPGLSPDR